MNPELIEALEDAIGAPMGDFREASAGGGCISDSRLITTEAGERFFVKFNSADKLEMFEAEADGLAELAAAGAIRVPAVFGSGRAGNQAFLALEAIELRGSGDSAELGRQLAELHRVSAPEFGWKRDNHIGATPQENGWIGDWSEFFAERRLRFQFRLAEKRGANIRGAEQLLERIPDLVGAHKPPPSLLHGDLWGGNAAFDENGQPVIFDPAVYFGDREAELAFTEMFGGFSAEFYAAYEESWPLPVGAADRKPLYNLYHVLNHFNLFGGGYARQAQSIIDRF